MSDARHSTSALWHTLLDGADDEALAALAPRLAARQQRAADEARVAAVSDHGPPPADGSASIVVALHHRLDLLEHQLAAFAGDPGTKDLQLVYVIDGPGLAEPAAELAPLLADLYRVRIRIVTLAAPGGRAIALDAGAQHADAPLLVLAGGGVIPSSPDWLAELAAAAPAAAPALLDEHGEPCAIAPHEHPCLLVAADAFRRAGGFGARLPGGLGAGRDLARRLHEHGVSVTHVGAATVTWRREADEPTVVPGARRYAAWLQAREEAECPTA